MNPEELWRLFETKPAVQTINDDNRDDIIVRLRESCPCIMCIEIVDEAVEEIERLRRGVDVVSQATCKSNDEVMKLLSNAILDTSPCGRDDCVSVSPEFLVDVRTEMARLREIVALAACLSVAARAAWRDAESSTPKMARLIAAAAAFESAAT